MGLGTLVQTLLIVLILLPGDVSRMGRKQQSMPLILWQYVRVCATICGFVEVQATIDVCAGISWVVQRPQYTVTAK
jgi:hypothetical protein